MFVEVIVTYLAAWLLYALYLSYCTLRQMRDTGRLAAMPRIVRFHCWGILYAALALDIVFNIIVGTLVFMELPELRRLTFTMRCKKWMTVEGRRGDIARWVCESWLNPAEPGHC